MDCGFPCGLDHLHTCKAEKIKYPVLWLLFVSGVMYSQPCNLSIFPIVLFSSHGVPFWCLISETNVLEMMCELQLLFNKTFPLTYENFHWQTDICFERNVCILSFYRYASSSTLYTVNWHAGWVGRSFELAPQRCQPDRLVTLDILLDLCNCDQGMTISLAR